MSQLAIDWNPTTSSATKALTEAALECARYGHFTSDDVLERVGPAIRECVRVNPNAVGAVFKALATQHAIEPAGQYVRSRRPEARGRRVGVWRRRSV